ncbi:hypothetical protein N2152v2_002847 [Parachlorella kessleri]
MEALLLLGAHNTAHKEMPAQASSPASSSSPTTAKQSTATGALVQSGLIGSLAGVMSLGYRRLFGKPCPEQDGPAPSSPEETGSQSAVQLQWTASAKAPADYETPFSSPEQGGVKGELKAQTSGLEEGLIRTSFEKDSAKACFGAPYNIDNGSNSQGRCHRPPSFDIASTGGSGDRRSSIDILLGLSGSSSPHHTDWAKIPETWNVVGFEELELAKAVGEGSFGQVYLAKYCHTIVAVKVLSQAKAVTPTSSSVQQSTLENLFKEIRIMSSLRHPNVTQYLGVCLDPPCLLMEYCSRKSVDAILQAAHDNPLLARQLTWGRLLQMALDAAKGMLYLHSRHPAIVHRDLKSANLLVDSHWHVKVTDFNLSKPVETQDATSTLVITNPRWLAPEVLQGGQANLASDVWAFGTVMWELMTWELPFAHMNPFQIFMVVNQDEEGSGLVIPPPGALPAGPLRCYDQYVGLMKACHSRDPAQRPTMDQVVTALLPLVGAESQSRRSSMCFQKDESRPEQQYSMAGTEAQSRRSSMCFPREESRPEQRSSLYLPSDASRVDPQSSFYFSSEGRQEGVAAAAQRSSFYLPACERQEEALAERRCSLNLPRGETRVERRSSFWQLKEDHKGEAPAPLAALPPLPPRAPSGKRLSRSTSPTSPPAVPHSSPFPLAGKGLELEVAAPSADLGVVTPQRSANLQDRAATASPESPSDLSKEPSEGSMPSTPGMAAAAQAVCVCQATEELLAAGHVTVANAGLSQMDSGVRGYPFAASGFFGMMSKELVE